MSAHNRTGFLGQSPKWDGAKPSPSGEPTTTKTERVVIVGYINGKPLSDTTTSGFRSPPLRRVSVTAADWGCTDQHKPQIIYQLLKGGVLFYHS